MISKSLTLNIIGFSACRCIFLLYCTISSWMKKVLQRKKKEKNVVDNPQLKLQKKKNPIL